MYKTLIFVLLVLLVPITGCTIVNADVNQGTIDVYTLMTSRQDVSISRKEDGTVEWKASRSNADSTIAEAALNMSKVAAKVSGVGE